MKTALIADSLMTAFRAGDKLKMNKYLAMLCETRPINEAQNRNTAKSLASRGAFREAKALILVNVEHGSPNVEDDLILALTLYRGQNPWEAIEPLKRADARKPDQPEVLNGFAHAYFKMWTADVADEATRDKAIFYLTTLRRLKLVDAEHLWMLHSIYLTTEDSVERKSVLDELLLQNPKDPLADHLSEALRPQSERQRCSPEYVRTLFDQASDTFDRELLDKLDYRVPRRIAECLEQTQPRGKCFKRALDLGCGTGLVGQAVHPWCNELIGVDLSPGMLEKAAEREIYDALQQADMESFLSTHLHSFEVIFAGDVLIYVGDISALFAAISERLTRNGQFIFSIELCDGPDFRLRPSGRFAHGYDYVVKALEKNGLRINFEEKIRLRKEGGLAVKGLLLSALKRPGPDAERPAHDADKDDYDRAVFYFEMNRFKEAAYFAQLAYKSNPQRAEVLDLLGVLAMHADQLDVALDCVRGAISIASDEPMFHTHLGMVLQMMNDINGAVSAFNRARHLAPEDPVVLINYGASLRLQGDHRSALGVFESLIEQGVSGGAIGLNLGLIYESLGHKAKATQTFEEAIKESPDAVHLRQSYADFLTRNEAEDAAEAQLKIIERLTRGHHSM